MTDFFNKWFYFITDLKQYENELIKIYYDNEPFLRMRNSIILPYFNLTLNYPHINEIIYDLLHIYTLYQHNEFEKNTYDENTTNWFWLPIYGVKNKGNGTDKSIKPNETTKWFVPAKSSILSFKHMFLKDERPLWLSILKPNGCISPHIDRKNYKKNIIKCRWVLSNDNMCKFVIKDIGELVRKPGHFSFFDHGLEHGVLNKSNNNKIDISIDFDYQKCKTILNESTKKSAQILLDETII